MCLSVRCLRRRSNVKISLYIPFYPLWFWTKNAVYPLLLIQKNSWEFGLVLPAFGIRRGKTRISSINHLNINNFNNSTQLNSTCPTVKEAVIYITVVYLCVSWERGHIAETVGHEYDEDTARSVQRQPNKHAGYCPEATQIFYSPLSAFSALFLSSERKSFKGHILKFYYRISSFFTRQLNQVKQQTTLIRFTLEINCFYKHLKKYCLTCNFTQAKRSLCSLYNGLISTFTPVSPRADLGNINS